MMNLLDSPSSNSSAYRPDIDGLRAIAVIAVFLFHLDYSFVPGGYVGVDVFFVITGFLFGKFVLTPLKEGSFNLAEYYDRRAQRLLPAFLIVMAATSLLAFLLLLPVDLTNFWKSLQSALFFYSNNHFTAGAGYFDTAAVFKPILHVWSLSAEAQFYFLFPLIALVAWKNKKSFWPLWLIGLISFALSAYFVFRTPVDAYYLLPSRAWEILLGTYVWVLYENIKKPGRLVSEILCFTGIILIAVSVFLYSSNTPFPGFAALMPCAGAGLIILGGKNNLSFFAKILSLRPLVYAGKISYSLYLIHWPMIVFSLYYLDRPLEDSEKLGVLALAFLVAALMHRFVEQPFRKKHIYNAPDGRYAFAGICLCFFLGIIFFPSLLGKGYAFRLPESAYVFSQARYDWTAEQSACPDDIPEKIKTGTLCRMDYGGLGRPDILLWGDSHATALLPAVLEAAKNKKLNVVVATTNGCPPVFGIETEKRHCKHANESVRATLQERSYALVILAANWNSYVKDNPLTIMESNEDFLSLLTKTTHEVEKQSKAILVGQMPRYEIDIPNYLAKKIFFGRAPGREKTSQNPVAMPDNKLVQRVYEQTKNTFLLMPEEVLCRDKICAIEKNGKSLYKDGGHLSATGALIFAPEFENIINNALK
jgi:peptidoglycan/LPS O-acetylase OafA/YrhL